MPGRAVVSGPALCAIAALQPPAIAAAVNIAESIFMFAVLGWNIGFDAIPTKCDHSRSTSRVGNIANDMHELRRGARGVPC
jgi:hypothetical protein